MHQPVDGKEHRRTFYVSASSDDKAFDLAVRARRRKAIAQVVNATFAARRAGIWGEGRTACASDSKKFGAWDQNLMTEWHIR